MDHVSEGALRGGLEVLGSSSNLFRGGSLWAKSDLGDPLLTLIGKEQWVMSTIPRGRPA